MRTRSGNNRRKQRRTGASTNSPTSSQLSSGVPRIKCLQKEGIDQISLDCGNDFRGYELLMEVVGTNDMDFLNGLLFQLCAAGRLGPDAVEDGANFILSIVKGIKPRDHFETMLAVQSAAVHMATMRFARSLALSDGIPQQDSAERALNKLARTYAIQMEAIKRYRTSGEQKVTVQHVSVSEGGQAIVGNVMQTPSGGPRNKVRTPLAIPDAKATAMPPIIEDKSKKHLAASHAKSRQK